MKLNLKTWLIELRAPFFTATFVPVIAGSLLAWAYFGIFKWFHFLLTIFGATMIHAGLNMINDYFDYISGNDVINKEKNPPFSGGSPFLPSGILKPKSVYFAAISCFLIGAIIGLFLAFDMGLENGWVIILIGIAGIGMCYFYVEPHVNIAGKGLGELFVFIGFGPFMVFGAYYVQVQSFSFVPLLLSIPIGCLIAAVLYINEFPDYEADKKVGKTHLVVRLGKEKAVNGYILLIAIAYAVILFLAIFNFIPLLCLFALLTLPIAVKAVRILKKEYKDSKKLIPAQAMTIQIHLFTGILLCIAIYISGAMNIV